MDDAVIALAASRASLKATRINKVAAERYSFEESKGRIQVFTKSSLAQSNSDPKTHKSEVSVECVGFSEKGDESVFRIEVSAQGFYEFPDKPDPRLLAEPRFAYLLDQRVYLRAVTEVHAIARSMNLGGMKVPPELNFESQSFTAPKAPSKKLAAKGIAKRTPQSKGVKRRKAS